MMFRYLPMLILLFSCANMSTTGLVKLKNKKENYTQKVSKVLLKTGKVEFVEIESNLADGNYTLDCKHKKIPVVVDNRKIKFIMSEGYFSKKKKYSCLLDGVRVLDVTVEQFPYPAERLNVSKKHVFWSKKDLARIIAEKPIKKVLYTNSANKFLYDKPFVVPLNSYVTSHFGNRRIFNNHKKTQHLGNDLRAKVGVKIPATNSGKVVFVGDLFFTGNVIVVDHGLEVFSMYGHLSKILVSKGMFVNQGEIIGLAGATGRVSGPHLHWTMKVNGESVDGFSLVEASKKLFSSYVSN